VELRDKFID
jgi:pre-mRNA-splicing factor RBM22/SLT11